MRIATMVTASHSYPLLKGAIYAPMVIAQTVAEGLVKKGHKVTFFAPVASKLRVSKVITGGLPPLLGKHTSPLLSGFHIRQKEQEKIFNLSDQYLLSLLYEEALKGKFDIIHIHPVDRALPFARILKTPTVYTLHDPIYPWRKSIFQLYQTSQQYYISISNAQRKLAPDLNWAETVYNGLDLKKFPFNEEPENHLLFLGRILAKKGANLAIKAATLAKEKLIIAGSPSTGRYWDTKIKPYLSKDIKYVNNIPYEETYRYYGRARALLCPIQWEEPFGLTFIEAMACGTPVIAFDRGSAKEVIKDGKTGFIVKNLKEMIGAIKKINQIDRKECRRRVEKYFTREKMIEEYEKIFYKILKSIPK